MNRAHRLLLPDPAARERLRRACEEDPPIVTPVWIATEGAAAICNTPKKERSDEAP